MPRSKQYGNGYGARRRRFSHRHKRRKVPTKARIYGRKGASAQANQIYKLSKTVDGLDDKMKEQYCHNYYMNYGSENVQADGSASALINCTNWTRTFQGTDLMDHAEFCYLSNMKVRCWAQIENAGNHQVMSCLAAVVSLKQPRAVQTYHRTANMNGAKLVGPSATNGEFVYSTPVGILEGNSMWKINPELFEVHDIYRFKVSNVQATAAADEVFVTNVADANKEFVLDAKVGRMKISQGYTTEGNQGWKNITAATGVERHKQRYLLLFTNSHGGNEIAWRWQMECKVTTLLQ